MKLKKAMKLYPIEKYVNDKGYTHYRLNGKDIFRGEIFSEKYFGAPNGNESESEAVAWLVEGAKKLSPMERAMREYPIKTEDAFGHRPHYYKLGGKQVEVGELEPCRFYYNDINMDFTHYTEEEAVAYLLEGYKKDEPKLPDYVIKGLNGVTIHYDQESSKAVMNNLWNAGYRPTKEAK